jgi:hypothetical protein
VFPNGISGSSVYAINTSAAFTYNGLLADPGSNVSVRFEPGVSGFWAGPVISENTDGVSVFMVGQSFNTATGGVSLFGYDGAAIDRNLDVGNGAGNGWVVGPHQSGVQNLANAANPIFATPAIGQGGYAAGSNIYSGNSLFVVDSVGGVSVFNKTSGAFQYAVQYGRLTTGNTVYAGPVTNGRWLVLFSDAGVSVYG